MKEEGQTMLKGKREPQNQSPSMAVKYWGMGLGGWWGAGMGRKGAKFNCYRFLRRTDESQGARNPLPRQKKVKVYTPLRNLSCGFTLWGCPLSAGSVPLNCWWAGTSASLSFLSCKMGTGLLRGRNESKKWKPTCSAAGPWLCSWWSHQSHHQLSHRRPV